MKKIQILVCLSAMFLAACNNGNDIQLPGEPELSDVPISLNAGVKTGSIEAETRAAVDGGSESSDELTLSFALANDQSDADPISYGNYGATFTAKRAAGVGSTPTQLTDFSTTQYYLTNGRSSKITGWYPAGTYTAGASAKVEWTITGAEDVMTAVYRSGTKKTPMPNLAFEHKLAQVQVYAYAVDDDAKTLWGNISNVTLTGQNNGCTYSFANDAAGTVTFVPGGDVSFEIYDNVTGKAPGVGAGNAVLIGVAMMEPKTAALNLNISTILGGTLTGVVVASREYLASNAYKITLKLDKGIITPTATIGGWTNTPDTDKEIVL